MSDIFKPISDDRTRTASGSDASAHVSGASHPAGDDASAGSGEAGKAVLAGVLGGFASAIGYIVYTRLPDEQKERLNGQVRTLVESRVNELRTRFNV